MTAQEIVKEGRRKFGNTFTDVAAWLAEQLQDCYGDGIPEVFEDLIAHQRRKH